MPDITIREQSQVERPKQRPIDANTPHGLDQVIADLSSSMHSHAFEGKTRYQCLQEVLAKYLGRVQVLAFNNYVTEVDADSLPEPSGSTNLALALDESLKLEPLMVLLISDGVPNSKSAAYKSAEKLAKQSIINVLYIGPSNVSAEAFMQEIANIGNGQYGNMRLDKTSSLLQLEEKIGSLLALPAPGTIEL